MPPFLVVSNRGPLSFALDDAGALRTRRGGGGLVTALGPAMDGTGAVWLAGALSEADREAASHGRIDAEGFTVELLALDEADHAAYYDVVSNSTLWFLHHGLWDAPRRPRFDRHWWSAWESYRRVNDAFARRAAELAEPGASVLVQDYHLCLVGGRLAQLRPDLHLVHFHHTPFASASEWRVLPDDAGRELLESLSRFHACGFHAPRWAASFEDCCRSSGVEVPTTFVAPAAVDAGGIREVAASPDCDAALAELDQAVGDRLVITRVDRIELSKNLVRGFLAFEELLQSRPRWREQVVFVACAYPSREGLADYQAYAHEVEGVIARINAEWATPEWTPIVYDPLDHFPRSVAALRRFDVLLVNPVRDGLNLVAKEGMVVNERDGVLALSRESGVFSEIGGAALEVHPFDVSGTAAVLDRALSMSPAERRAHAVAVGSLATAGDARAWLRAQLEAGATATT